MMESVYHTHTHTHIICILHCIIGELGLKRNERTCEETEETSMKEIPFTGHLAQGWDWLPAKELFPYEWSFPSWGDRAHYLAGPPA